MGVKGLGKDEEGSGMKIAQLEKFQIVATFFVAQHISTETTQKLAGWT